MVKAWRSRGGAGGWDQGGLSSGDGRSMGRVPFSPKLTEICRDGLGGGGDGRRDGGGGRWGVDIDAAFRR